MSAMDDEAIKQQLYNRQGYVVGAETQRKYGEMRVAVVGLGGPGCEVAKNLILTGIKQVTLVDDSAITWHDLSSVFYANEADVGKPMAKTLEPRLAELNRFATVAVAAADGNNMCPDDVLLQQHVVIYCNKNTSLLTRENALCRANGVRFVSCESRGVACSVFVDTGDEFIVNDKNGEELVTCVVTDVDQDNAVVMLNDDKKHETEPGDKVYFTDVEGCTMLNSADPAQPTLFEVLEVVSPFAVKIKVEPEGALKAAPMFKGRGYMHTTKQPVTVKCKSLEASLDAPDFNFVFDDEAKLCANGELHALFRGLHKVAPNAAAHAPITAPVDLAALATAAGSDLSKELLDLIGPTLHGNLNPMACFIGGFAAQEVLKCGSGKFTPVFQWLHYDAREVVQSMPNGVVPPEAERAPLNCRYDGQIAVFGRTFQQTLQNTSAFIVGAGALGCEHIKNVAMIGLGCPEDASASSAKITITDMDTIELSNLSRQFLFRSHHIGKPKSTVAAGAAVEINKALRVEALEQKVARETENVFNEAFWEGQGVIMNALDNVIARKYVDERCVDFQRPLFESGTLGAKCNTQCVIPYLTENYGNSADPPEKDIPLCTLKNTPSAIEHTIQWARDAFHGYFVQGPSDASAYLSDPAGFLAGLARDPSNKPTVLKSLVDGIAKRPTSAQDCVAWARLRFEDSFNLNIRQLLHNMPPDFVTPNGQPFWSGARRPPTPLDFNSADELHMLFIRSAAGIVARIYGLSAELQALPASEMASIAQSTPVPAFVPRRVQYATGPDAASQKQEDPSAIAATDLTDADMPDPAKHQGLQIAPEEFEKDDDANGHIDFITATSNLRATNYGIPIADRVKTKMIAGKIIPAMITTTALVTGLVAVEVLKYLVGAKKRELFRNAFVNIALPLVALSEPVEVPKGTEYVANDGRKMAFTMWDKVEVGDGSDITVGDAIDSIEQRYGVDVCMMSTPGGLLVYNGLMPNPKARSVLMREKLEALFKKPLDESVKTVSLVLNATVNDEDLDLPAVRFRIRK
eukprot:CAMPEP_0174828300 /NCGR_PEP_ID=MMETSP1114-20130205/1243_1 /TAXON_ID=312471 /ORGANISM="Neobodo designis, Strain CCAP 1951/1" /LENGTH=1030 /DNA_ID=CAMNT_0016062013 /DNA_START=130 /DNA_END=3222 /DNA_ORIENTATION=+